MNSKSTLAKKRKQRNIRSIKRHRRHIPCEGIEAVADMKGIETAGAKEDIEAAINVAITEGVEIASNKDSDIASRERGGAGNVA